MVAEAPKIVETAEKSSGKSATLLATPAVRRMAKDLQVIKHQVCPSIGIEFLFQLDLIG